MKKKVPDQLNMPFAECVETLVSRWPLKALGRAPLARAGTMAWWWWVVGGRVG